MHMHCAPLILWEKYQTITVSKQHPKPVAEKLLSSFGMEEEVRHEKRRKKTLIFIYIAIHSTAMRHSISLRSSVSLKDTMNIGNMILGISNAMKKQKNLFDA